MMKLKLCKFKDQIEYYQKKLKKQQQDLMSKI